MMLKNFWIKIKKIFNKNEPKISKKFIDMLENDDTDKSFLKILRKYQKE